MIIGIASGKGGTGKTTLATNLAKSIDAPVRFLDCDVEEPNAHLFLNPKITDHATVTTIIPLVDQQRCSGCRKCQMICRFRAITVIKGKVLTFPELCHGCGGCMVICPEQAITEGSREIGQIDSGQAGTLQFSMGTLRVGETMTPPLIKAVRNMQADSPTVIIDAPPGTSCPVITAVKGTDYVVLVTEPTPFGVHDLTLAIETIGTLGIPFGLVINRSDIGDRHVYDLAATQNIPVLLEIPFDRAIASAYSRGQLLIDILPHWQEKFQDLFEKIKQMAVRGGGKA